MENTEEVTLVHRFYDEAWNRWDDTVVDEILAETFTFRGSLGDEVRGREGWRAYRDTVRRGIPDLHNEVVDLVTSPGRAAARLRYTGHHRGALLGQPGHGAPIDYPGAAFFRCGGGRLESAWVLGDLDRLRAQIRAPAPVTAATDLQDLVRRVLAANTYMVLGTADDRGRPWTAPVFFVADARGDLLWISSPDVTHSRNIAGRPEVSIVVYDSRAPVGAGGDTAVYLAATAAEVDPADLDRTLADMPSFADRGGRALASLDLRPPAPYRLFRATVTEQSVLCPRPAGAPCAEHGLAYDHRTRVARRDPPPDRPAGHGTSESWPAHRL